CASIALLAALWPVRVLKSGTLAHKAPTCLGQSPGNRRVVFARGSSLAGVLPWRKVLTHLANALREECELYELGCFVDGPLARRRAVPSRLGRRGAERA